MRRLQLIFVIAFFLLAVSACQCPLQVETVDRLEKSVVRQQEKYLRYVEADPKLSKEQKEIEKDNCKSQLDLIESIKKIHK